ncbi:MAG: sulfatase [Planctomycetota bacterium]
MERPLPRHIVWITTDHMRYDCIGAHGNPAMATPNLDRLVNEGISFDRCYAQNPVCMPSRASFMTGCYPQQTGVTTNGHELAPDFPFTPGRCFGAAGFHTAQIGKLHFQNHEDNDLDPRQREAYGFDVCWLSEEPGCYQDAYMTWLGAEHPELVTTFRVPRSSAPERYVEREGRVLDAPWEASHSGWVALQADRYLSGNGPRGRHMVHLGFYAPHPPLNPTAEMFAPYRDATLPARQAGPEEWSDKPRPLADMLRMCDDWDEERHDAYRRHFYAMVTGVDLGIGRVLACLERLGVLEDTLIVFTSDHGDMCGDHGMILKGHHFYDEVMRVPLVLWWPRGFGTEGRRVAGLTEMVDLLPTLLELGGGVAPDRMAGRSLAPALLAGEAPEGRDSVFAFQAPDNAMIRTERHKYIHYGASGGEVLFDIEADGEDRVNRAADPAWADALHDMRLRLMQRALATSASIRQHRLRF